MFILTGKGLKDNNKTLIGCISDSLEVVKNNLEILDKDIIRLQEEIAYFTVDNISFGKLLGSCRMLFRKNILIQIVFTPSLKEYIRKLSHITRQGVYSCVYDAYRELNNYILSLDYSCIESNERRSVYQHSPYKMTVIIDNTNESVCVIQEVLNE